MGRCITPYCRRSAKKEGQRCTTCKTREYRAKYPMISTFQNLKSNAKRRGKFFDLTFQQFEMFCIKTDHMVGKGRTKTSYHIDRKDEEIGYTYSNLQVLTNTENVLKYRKSLQFNLDERGVPTEFYVKSHNTIKSKPSDDCPF